MTVSIIIPSFQQGNYLISALHSIGEQLFTDYEVLIMDAGSTDSTQAILADFEYLPISFYQAPDLGVYDAMNKGIKQAKGEWLYFMGCDDQLHNPAVLSSLSSNFEDEALDVFYGDVVMKSDQSRYAGAFSLDRLLRSQNICHQALFYRRTVFEKIGFYNLKYKVWADWEFNIRCFRHTELIIKYVDVIVALYNNESGISHVQDEILKIELPVFYLGEINFLETQKKKIFESKSYLISKKLANMYAMFGRLFRLSN